MKNKRYNLVAVEQSGCRWTTYYTHDLDKIMQRISMLDTLANRCQQVSNVSNTPNREVVAAWTLDDQSKTENRALLDFLPIFNQTPIIGFELWIIDYKRTSISLRYQFLGR